MRFPAGEDLRFADTKALEIFAGQKKAVAAHVGASALQQNRERVHSAELPGKHACRWILLQRAGADVRRDRLFLPGEDLERFRVSESEVLACRESQAFQTLMAFQADRILDLYTQALTTTPPSQLAMLPSLILAALDRALLTEIRADGYHVLSRQIVLTPLRRLWTAWRTRRHARRRRPVLAGARLG